MLRECRICHGSDREDEEQRRWFLITTGQEAAWICSAICMLDFIRIEIQHTLTQMDPLPLPPGQQSSLVDRLIKKANPR